MIDLIFWYTGWFVWAVIACMFAVCVFIIFTASLYRMRKLSQKIILLWIVGRRGMTEKQVRQSRHYFDTYGPPDGCSQEDFFKWLEGHADFVGRNPDA